MPIAVFTEINALTAQALERTARTTRCETVTKNTLLAKHENSAYKLAVLDALTKTLKCVRNMDNYVADGSILDIELFTTTVNMFLSLIVHIVS